MIRTFNIYPLSNFQICNAVLLTLVIMLYITLPWLIYFITESLFVLNAFTHFALQQSVLCMYAAAAKSLQSCPTLCDSIDGSPPGSPVPGILQARALEWVANSFSSAWKWKVKVKSLSCVRLLATPWTAAYQAPPSMAGGAFSFPPCIF